MAELSRSDYGELSLPFDNRKSAYLVEPVTFVGGGAWKPEATTAKRTMRFSSKSSDGSVDASAGVLNSVTYASGALVASGREFRL